MYTALVIGSDFRSGYEEVGFGCSVSHGRSGRERGWAYLVGARLRRSSRRGRPGRLPARRAAAAAEQSSAQRAREGDGTTTERENAGG